MISVWQLAADHTVGGQNRTADGNGSLILHSAVGRDSNRLGVGEGSSVSIERTADQINGGNIAVGGIGDRHSAGVSNLSGIRVRVLQSDLAGRSILDQLDSNSTIAGIDSRGLVNDLDEHSAQQAIGELEPNLIVGILADGGRSGSDQSAVSADVVDLAAIIEGIELAADLHNGVGGSLSANRGEEVGAVNLGSRIVDIHVGDIAVAGGNALAVVRNTGQDAVVRDSEVGLDLGLSTVDDGVILIVVAEILGVGLAGGTALDEGDSLAAVGDVEVVGLAANLGLGDDNDLGNGVVLSQQGDGSGVGAALPLDVGDVGNAGVGGVGGIRAALVDDEERGLAVGIEDAAVGGADIIPVAGDRAVEGGDALGDLGGANGRVTRVSRQGQGVLLVAVDGVGDHIVLVQIGVGRGIVSQTGSSIRSTVGLLQSLDIDLLGGAVGEEELGAGAIEAGTNLIGEDDRILQGMLSDSWIREDKTNVDRVLAVTSSVSNQLFADIYIKNRTTRPMPMYSIPGLIDHH